MSTIGKHNPLNQEAVKTLTDWFSVLIKMDQAQKIKEEAEKKKKKTID